MAERLWESKHKETNSRKAVNWNKVSTESGVTMNGSPAELWTITRGEQKKVWRACIEQQSSMWGPMIFYMWWLSPGRRRSPSLRGALSHKYEGERGSRKWRNIELDWYWRAWQMCPGWYCLKSNHVTRFGTFYLCFHSLLWKGPRWKCSDAIRSTDNKPRYCTFTTDRAWILRYKDSNSWTKRKVMSQE